jgi:ribosomal protein L24
MPKEHAFLSHNHRTGQVVVNAKENDVVVEGVNITWSDAKITQG